MMKSVRFRTLGCYPLTGAVESTAATLPEIIQEMLLTTTSERQGRVIDHDQVFVLGLSGESIGIVVHSGCLADKQRIEFGDFSVVVLLPAMAAALVIDTTNP